MRFTALVVLLILFSCADKPAPTTTFSSVEVEIIHRDSINIRAIEFLDGSLAFAGDHGIYGSVDLATDQVRTAVQAYDSLLPEFRAIGHTKRDFFMLSVGSPALLYKTGESGRMELVYTETGEGVFYDAMAFWDDREGLAIGDSTGGCLSIVVTRDGGRTWRKIPCTLLPPSKEGEGAFAASNTNIAIQGDTAWVATTASRVFRTTNRGRSWEVVQSPMGREAPAQGIFSMAFYDAERGFAIGGDYTQPEVNRGNKAMTLDGGKTWELVADGQNPGYKSCLQFVPNSEGEGIVAVGYTGISYSPDFGRSWVDLSSESFYTIRFLDDSTAYAAGRNRIAKLRFK